MYSDQQTTIFDKTEARDPDQLSHKQPSRDIDPAGLNSRQPSRDINPTGLDAQQSKQDFNLAGQNLDKIGSSPDYPSQDPPSAGPDLNQATQNSHQDSDSQPSQDLPLATSDTTPSPTTNPSPFSKLFIEYLDEIQEAIRYEKRASISPIQVDELATRVAKLYEQVRRIIDWKEEHLVRRTAIERIFKRRLLSEISGIGITPGLNAEEMAEPLIYELIRSGYFSNGSVSRHRIPEAKEALSRYIYVLNHSPVSQKANLNVKDKISFYHWFLEIAACELEQILDPALKENALLNIMTNSIYYKTQVHPEGAIDDNEKLIQVYISVHRTLFNLDSPLISFNLMKLRYPEWFEVNSVTDQAWLREFAQNIVQVRDTLEADLTNKKGGPFYRLCQVYDAAYLVLGDVIKKLIKDDVDDVGAELADAKKLNELIETIYAKRLKTLKSRLTRAAIYSTLSIFLSSIASYLVFEGPVAKFIAHREFSYFALAVDLAVPTAVMAILVLIIRTPSESNLARVKNEIKKIVYQQDEEDAYEVSLKKKKKYFLNSLFAMISLVAGSATMIGIWWIFKIAGVPWTSLYIDTISVAMIVFAAMIIRDRSKEITIQEKGSFGEFFVDLFTLPLARVGQWFSSKWREYNFVSVFFSALIDTPFSVLIATIEDWRSFLKERRSEIH